MNKKLLAGIMSCMVVVTPSVGFAGMRSQPANLGTARVGSQAYVFTHSFVNGSVTAGLTPADPPTADWALGLVMGDGPRPLSTKVTLYARATSPGALARIVWSDAAGNVTGATAFQALPVTAPYQALQYPLSNSFGEFVFVDAIMNNGASILGADFNN